MEHMRYTKKKKIPVYLRFKFNWRCRAGSDPVFYLAILSPLECSPFYQPAHRGARPYQTGQKISSIKGDIPHQSQSDGVLGLMWTLG